MKSNFIPGILTSMKTLFTASHWRRVLLVCALGAVLSLPAVAQSAPAATTVSPGAHATGAGSNPSIGPAAANTPQDNILHGALSSKTRETLQDAMNSYPANRSTATGK